MEDIEFHTRYRNRADFRISGSLIMEINPDRLWSVSTEEGHLKNFHPFCENHAGMALTGVGCADSASFYNGMTVNREVVFWNEGVEYGMKLTGEEGNTTYSNFVIEKIDSNRSGFSVHIMTNAYRKIPRPIWHLYARFFLLPSYKNYLRSLLYGVNYFATSGIKVVKNQFGRHKFFSP